MIFTTIDQSHPLTFGVSPHSSAGRATGIAASRHRQVEEFVQANKNTRWKTKSLMDTENGKKRPCGVPSPLGGLQMFIEGNIQCSKMDDLGLHPHVWKPPFGSMWRIKMVQNTIRTRVLILCMKAPSYQPGFIPQPGKNVLIYRCMEYGMECNVSQTNQGRFVFDVFFALSHVSKALVVFNSKQFSVNCPPFITELSQTKIKILEDQQ